MKKKKKYKKTSSTLFSTLSRHLYVYFGVLIVLALIGCVTVLKTKPQKSILENDLFEMPKNEMHKLPTDVKKNLALTPSPSLLATIRVPILLYHYVEYVQDKGDKIRQSLDITPNTFESQVITLKDAGYTFMTAKELGDVLDGKMSLPKNPVLLTFDDGHWDFDTVVLPILKKYHVKATAYIISRFIGGSDFMTPQELQDVIASGLIDVGAHTQYHLALKGLPQATDTTEIAGSKDDLEKTYHIHVVSFAYPSGSFDLQAINTVKAAGFTTAVSTIPGIEQNQENRFFLYRLRPGYRTGEELLNYLAHNSFTAY